MASGSRPALAIQVVLSAQTGAKKKYEKPQLNDFGTITELTAAGSGNAGESSTMLTQALVPMP